MTTETLANPSTTFREIFDFNNLLKDAETLASERGLTLTPREWTGVKKLIGALSFHMLLLADYSAEEQAHADDIAAMLDVLGDTVIAAIENTPNELRPPLFRDKKTDNKEEAVGPVHT